MAAMSHQIDLASPKTDDRTVSLMKRLQAVDAAGRAPTSPLDIGIVSKFRPSNVTRNPLESLRGGQHGGQGTSAPRAGSTGTAAAIGRRGMRVRCEWQF
jgi:hypothetical protein